MMLQLYFLLVFCNISAGFALIHEKHDAGTAPSLALPYRLALGIVAILTGLLTLVSPIDGDVPVVGDLAPSLTSIALGLSLVYEYFGIPSVESGKNTNIAGILLNAHRKTLGRAGILAGVLHFLLPRVMFL